ncbi:MAG: DUF2357 domain-containing protein [Clostridia bacterium]|nr:DUF2357 domain-containing protein [Clostridia bacterium]
MKNNSLSILKNFTRKLANCRYRVAVDTLVDDLLEGGFGYTTEEGLKEVVNNDFVLADDFETLLESIRVIFRSPRLHLKKENVVMRAEAASKFDTTTLKATYKDEKLWRIKDGAPSPEYVHSYVYEDDYAIYENRFVCFVIDEILQEVSKKINELAKTIETLNKKMGAKKKSFSPNDYVNFIGEEAPVLITDDDVNVKIFTSLIKSKKWLISLKSTPLYLACKKAGTFNPLGLKPTNILTKDSTYYTVYNFYLNYLNKEPSFQTEQGMYLGYVTVNLFAALKQLGFVVNEETSKVGITNSAAIKFNKVEFSLNAFRVVLSQEENAVVMTVKTPDDNEGKYLFKVLSNEESAKDKSFTTVTNYVKKLSIREDVIKTFVVNDVKQVPNANAIYIKPTMPNAVEVLVGVLKTCLLVGVGSTFMYSRYCPVCGSSLISSSIEGYTCSNCKTLYHVFEYENKGMVWFKNFTKNK